MATLQVKDGSGTEKHLAGSGAGTENDPFVALHQVTGPLTNAELRAAAVEVEVVNAGAIGVTGPLTNAELRAAAVEVEGPLTKAQLDQSVVTVTGELSYAPTVIEMLSGVSWLPHSFEGDLQVLAPPGATLQVVIDELFFQNEEDVPCVIVLKSGGSTYRRLRLVADGDFVHWLFPAGKELRLPANGDLTINRAGETQVGYMMRYRFETV